MQAAICTGTNMGWSRDAPDPTAPLTFSSSAISLALASFSWISKSWRCWLAALCAACSLADSSSKERLAPSALPSLWLSSDTYSRAQHELLSAGTHDKQMIIRHMVRGVSRWTMW